MPSVAVDIDAAIKPLPVLRNRRRDRIQTEAKSAFARLCETENGAVFAGSFEGESPWERHPNGDELVQVLKGAARLFVIEGGETRRLDLAAGTVTVVPRGCWHRFEAPKGVTVLTMTPQPTDHSTAETPPDDGAR